ncbi:uncharacterized protein LOC115785097 isoform X2 [Archocentrus centrarchus]|uniref:uncharacterized protein LOC115785097 isoform X2 n=1 Tax=Archocentrus centrarchus TaxID=63155 RepID=UPI0011E9E128|nr:uncharacterized protein LOC115785097 isoform X2 [Archocentrus centrarchus]
MSKPEELRVVLIGRTTTLVTSAKDIMEKHLTETKSKMVLVDAPGLCQKDKDEKEVLSEIVTSIFKSGSQRGPHVFLYVQEWENYFNKHDKDRMELFKLMFGNDSMRYFLPLITGVRKELSEDDKKKIVDFFEKYGFESKKFGVIGKDVDKAKEQVAELEKEITEMDKKNNGAYYTVDMLKEAQEALLKKIPGNKHDDAKESSLHCAARDLLTQVLGPDTARLVLQANTWLAKKLAECM